MDTGSRISPGRRQCHCSSCLWAGLLRCALPCRDSRSGWLCPGAQSSWVSPCHPVSSPPKKTPNTRAWGAGATHRPQQGVPWPTGGGGRHLLGTGESASAAYSTLVFPTASVLRAAAKNQRGAASSFLPTSFSEQLLHVPFSHLTFLYVRGVSDTL